MRIEASISAFYGAFKVSDESRSEEEASCGELGSTEQHGVVLFFLGAYQLGLLGTHKPDLLKQVGNELVGVGVRVVRVWVGCVTVNRVGRILPLVDEGP